MKEIIIKLRCTENTVCNNNITLIRRTRNGTTFSSRVPTYVCVCIHVYKCVYKCPSRRTTTAILINILCFYTTGFLRQRRPRLLLRLPYSAVVAQNRPTPHCYPGRPLLLAIGLKYKKIMFFFLPTVLIRRRSAVIYAVVVRMSLRRKTRKFFFLQFISPKTENSRKR